MKKAIQTIIGIILAGQVFPGNIMYLKMETIPITA